MNHIVKRPKSCNYGTTKIAIKTIGALILILFLNLHIQAQETIKNNSGVTTDSCKILFLGSSYFGCNNLPNLIENLADSSGKKVYIDQYIPGGLFLSDHASSSVTELKINELDWDFVILQGVGSLTAYPDSFTTHPVYPALATLKDKIYENCESTKMVFCLPWAFEDGMTWYGWPDTYADMQLKIYNNTLLYSNDLDFPIAPVGWAWYAVLEELSYPLHFLHMSDWNHPSLKGSYLMACVIYSTVFLESSVGNTYGAGLPEDEVIYFQTVGSSIVLDSLKLWNITANTGIDEFLKPNNIHLYQNYPNPFHSTTQINYEIRKNAFVEMVIYDGSGKQCATLVKEYKLPGIHSVSFNGTDLNNGIYYFRIQIDNEFQVKKMLLTK